MRKSAVKRFLPLLCPILLVCLLLTGFRSVSEDGDTPAAQAARVEAAIDALKTVTLKSESDILAARELYDSLSDEARALVSNVGRLEAAEQRLQLLKDGEAAKAIKKLISAGKFADAIACAEACIGERPIGEVQEAVIKSCLRAYARQAASLTRKKRNEEAYTLLLACRETYAGADTSEIDTALRSLERTIAEPENGTFFSSRARGEYGTVTIRTGGFPAVVKLVSTSDEKNAVTVYVRADSSVSVRLKDGTYYVLYAAGDKWFGEDELFGSTTRCRRVDTVLRFSCDSADGCVCYQTYTVKLAAADGSASEPIERDRF